MGGNSASSSVVDAFNHAVSCCCKLGVTATLRLAPSIIWFCIRTRALSVSLLTSAQGTVCKSVRKPMSNAMFSDASSACAKRSKYF